MVAVPVIGTFDPHKAVAAATEIDFNIYQGWSALIKMAGSSCLAEAGRSPGRHELYLPAEARVLFHNGKGNCRRCSLQYG